MQMWLKTLRHPMQRFLKQHRRWIGWFPVRHVKGELRSFVAIE
jgi:hypothetical protein